MIQLWNRIMCVGSTEPKVLHVVATSKFEGVAGRRYLVLGSLQARTDEEQRSGANVCLETRLGISQGETDPGVDPDHGWPIERIKALFQRYHRAAGDTPIAPILGSNVTLGNHYGIVTRYGIFTPGGTVGSSAQYWANFWAGSFRSSTGVKEWMWIGDPVKLPDELVNGKVQLDVVELP